MNEFLAYDRTHEIVVVSPLFKTLQESMTLDKHTVAVENEDMTERTFNVEYLTKNRPVKVEAMCHDWGMAEKWNFEYLS